MRSRDLLLATRSAGKLRELRRLLEGAGLVVVDLAGAGVAAAPAEDEIESAPTFEGNALAKARYFFKLTGRSVIADDSGLEVRALGGQPGIHSKRWSGRSDLTGQALDDANNARLLAELAGKDDRVAQYVCVAAYVDSRTEARCRGVTHGIILDEPRGNSGFGYDPYFLSTELGKTFGEAELWAKEQVSHRGRAFRALLRTLAERG